MTRRTRWTAGLLSIFASVARAGDVTLPRFPTVSPDGREIAFAWHGDLWRAPIEGGDATRLTADPADDLYPAFSRDGKSIAFTSERLGGGNVFTMGRDGSGVRALTASDQYLRVYDFADDGPLVGARLEPDAYPSARPYRVPLDAGDPVRLFDAFGTAPAISPDGTKILFERGGAPWSRRGYRGSDNRDVWLYDRETKRFRQLTDHPGNDGRAKWVDDRTFVYASDREEGTTNLFLARLDDAAAFAATRLTSARGSDIDEFSIARDGRTLVYAQGEHLFRLDLAEPNKPATAIPLRAADEAPAERSVDVKDRVTDVALSPDGKTLASIAFGQLWVRATALKAPSRRVNDAFARCASPAWSPDGTLLYFSSDANGHDAIYFARVTRDRAEIKLAATRSASTTQQTTRPAMATSAATTEAATTTHSTSQPTSEPASQPATRPLELPTVRPSSAGASRPAVALAAPERWADATAFEVTPLVDSGLGDRDPLPSPDGKWLAFARAQGQLWLRDLATGDERQLYAGWQPSLEFVWSPDSTRLAYVGEDRDNNRDVFLIDVDGDAAPTNVSQHPDNDDSPRFSADGKLLFFLSSRAENSADVYRVALDPAIDALAGTDLDDYYRHAAEAAKSRRPIAAMRALPSPRASSTRPATRPLGAPSDALADAYRRVKKLTSMPGDEGDLQVSPAGDRVIFTADAPGGRATFALDRDASEPKRIQSEVSPRGVNLAGDRLAVVAGGRSATMNAGSGELYYLDVESRLRVDRRELWRQEFAEAARLVGDLFYDARLNGLDWPDVTQKYLARLDAIETPDEFNWLAAKLVGELNASHLGVRIPEPRAAGAFAVGRLGIVATRVEGGYRVDRVYADGPGAAGPMRLVAGDVIVAVEGARLDAPAATLDRAMRDRVGLETIVRVRRGDGDGERDLLITPASSEADESLAYGAWRDDNARRVAEWSGGRLGYLHLRSMDQQSLESFERDLFAAANGKEGVVLDVRNNGGGWTTDRLLASIAAPRHAHTRSRGQPERPGDDWAYPADRLFIQRYVLPMSLLANEKSVSNAEIIAHAFQELKRGALVGTTTAGEVISAGGTTLLDGTSVRLPSRGWFGLDGIDYEGHGAMPDVRVPQTPEDESSGEDRQLRAAVEGLLSQLHKSGSGER